MAIVNDAIVQTIVNHYGPDALGGPLQETDELYARLHIDPWYGLDEFLDEAEVADEDLFDEQGQVGSSKSYLLGAIEELTIKRNQLDHDLATLVALARGDAHPKCTLAELAQASDMSRSGVDTLPKPEHAERAQAVAAAVRQRLRERYGAEAIPETPVLA